ncbi:hypothetical protein L6J37_11525 [Photobacterium sp. WH77]|nr:MULTISPECIES: hypothetical protein [unclassified Photobacterium]MCG2837459.1 hypothetical protein [Photobacterium sp. WH77]MCG2844971.1 hypothetical protein [Photobacterium sp. WH80]
MTKKLQFESVELQEWRKVFNPKKLNQESKDSKIKTQRKPQQEREAAFSI